MPTLLAQTSRKGVLSNDRINSAHKFMRAIYPDLSNHNYFLGVQTFLRYDNPETPITWIQLDIGEGPKDFVLYEIGGCAGEVVQPLYSPPWPLELGPPPTDTQQAPSAPPQTSKQNQHECRPGPAHPKQFLSARFWFDADGRLTNYNTVSPGVREFEEMNHFASLVLSHPEMSDAEVLAALKNAGAKYGPNDQDEFVKHAPIAALEPFLGKLQVLSVSYAPLFENRNNVAEWPKWTIKVKATRDDGADAFYELSFEQFRGELRSLHLIQPERNKS
jgi:hypothetical protein